MTARVVRKDFETHLDKSIESSVDPASLLEIDVIEVKKYFHPQLVRKGRNVVTPLARTRRRRG